MGNESKSEMFGFLFKKKALNNVGHEIFASVIDQSRNSIFYSDLAVEDNLDGRFDLMSLHMAMVLQKFDQHQAVPDAAKLKQLVQEIMFDNLDLTLREIGVGDLGVGKKIKVMAEAFYGRMMVYQDLFQSADVEKMSDALRRNLYREKQIDQNILSEMTHYAYGQFQKIETQNIEGIMAGKVNFLAPSGNKNG